MFHAPKILRSNSSRNCSSVVSSSVAISDRPALQTSPSMPPKRFSVVVMKASAAFRSVTSQDSKRMESGSAQENSLNASSSRSTSRAHAATRAPSPRRSRAVARPTPELAPVTTTVRSFNCRSTYGSPSF